MSSPEPDEIAIQHCLVSFKETPVEADRSKDDAQALAAQILERARGGEDFNALVREFSDDPSPADHPQPGT